jgi:hypothetical protein
VGQTPVEERAIPAIKTGFMASDFDIALASNAFPLCFLYSLW